MKAYALIIPFVSITFHPCINSYTKHLYSKLMKHKFAKKIIRSNDPQKDFQKLHFEGSRLGKLVKTLPGVQKELNIFETEVVF